ncbi:pilus assembly protein PilN [Aneurinibacillus sp. BA2021]|nr:pilus assembly protein PilN [Aneurinibacillus sp. BA2021]
MININLLPRKKSRFSRVHILYLVIGIIWVTGAGYVGTLYITGKQEVSALRKEIEQTDKLLEQKKQNQQQEGQTVTVDSYLELSDKLQHLFYPTTLMLDEMASNLPRNGRLTGVTYNLNGKVELEGRFEQYEDIAAYLHNLQLSKRVIVAQVKNITAIKIEWEGPKDDNGDPLSPSLQIVGGKLLPHYSATFELMVQTIDKAKISQKGKAPAQSAADTKQDGVGESGAKN